MTVSKYIFTDLDGTLLNDAKEISLENKQALVAALDLGHHIYIATGRPYLYARALADTIDNRAQVVSYNGAVYEADELVSEVIPENLVEILIETINRYDVHYMFKTIDKLYHNGEMNDHFAYDSFGMESIQGIENCPRNELIKVLIIQGKIDDTTFIKLVNELNDQFEVNYYLGKGCEIIKKGLHKGKAISAIAKRQNIATEDIIVFGDDVNDTSMFEVAGTSIATDNAIDSIKELADVISTDCNDSAIAYGLKHIKII